MSVDISPATRPGARHSGAPVARPASLPLFRRALADSWRSTLGWTIGLTAAAFLYLPLFPSIGGNEQMQQLIDALPKQLVESLNYDQLSSGAGYAQATFYGLIGFLVISIASVSWGTAAIAGDEETGTLELTLAHGVTRVQLVLERALAILVRLAWLVIVSAALVLGLNGPAELDLESANVLAMSAAWLGLGLIAASAALAVGALSGRRSYALVAGAGVAVLGYVLNAVANQSEDVEFLHDFSPYAWAFGADPLAQGADWGGLGLLYGFTALFAAVAVAAFARRDVS